MKRIALIFLWFFIGSVDNCSKPQSPPTFRGLSAESMDPVDKPRGVGYGVNCQQTLISASQAEPVEILLWHSLAGHLGHQLDGLVNGFNMSQNKYTVKTVYKGDYVESLTSFAAAFRAHQPPAIVQVFEVGTSTMLNPIGVIKPVHELMKEEQLTLPESSFFPAVLAHYSKKGHLMAMPFNISLPVLFYNADALKKVGYSSENFPKTWDGLEILAYKLKKSGVTCAYTSAYPAWVFIESFAALHGLPMMDVTTKKAVYNNKKIVAFLERLVRWKKLHFFEYGGQTDDATVLFTSGRCAILSESSGTYTSLAELVSFPVGMASLPTDNSGGVPRFNNVVGGAAFWAVANQKPVVYHGVAQFFSYLATPEVQQKWHQNTGYLPLGVQGVYKKFTLENNHPSLLLAQTQLMSSINLDKPPSFGPQNQIRAINDEALEEIFAGIKTPRQAMDDAVIRSNHALTRSVLNTSG